MCSSAFFAEIVIKL